MPDTFNLYVPAMQSAYQVQIRWRSAAELGVAFLDRLAALPDDGSLWMALATSP
jgi:hypothetical protein